MVPNDVRQPLVRLGVFADRLFLHILSPNCISILENTSLQDFFQRVYISTKLSTLYFHARCCGYFRRFQNRSPVVFLFITPNRLIKKGKYRSAPSRLNFPAFIRTNHQTECWQRTGILVKNSVCESKGWQPLSPQG